MSIIVKIVSTDEGYKWVAKSATPLKEVEIKKIDEEKLYSNSKWRKESDLTFQTRLDAVTNWNEYAEMEELPKKEITILNF